MQIITDRPQALTASPHRSWRDFHLVGLNPSTSLITSLLPGGGEKMSKQAVRSGDVAGLWERFSSLRTGCRSVRGRSFQSS